MISWFTIIQVVIASLAGLYCVGLGISKRAPNDAAILSVALVELLLIVQLIIALVAPGFGNVATGSVLEFFVYLVTALLIPPIAVLWALMERSRWSSVVLGIAAISIAIKIYRMQQIWAIQLA